MNRNFAPSGIRTVLVEFLSPEETTFLSEATISLFRQFVDKLKLMATRVIDKGHLHSSAQGLNPHPFRFPFPSPFQLTQKVRSPESGQFDRCSLCIQFQLKRICVCLSLFVSFQCRSPPPLLPSSSSSLISSPSERLSACDPFRKERES